jgi:hypothetical protein
MPTATLNIPYMPRARRKASVGRRNCGPCRIYTNIYAFSDKKAQHNGMYDDGHILSTTPTSCYCLWIIKIKHESNFYNLMIRDMWILFMYILATLHSD